VNYTQLKQLIQDYTQNYETTFVADIPTFVEQAEQRIYNSVQFPSLRKNVTGTITQYNQYLAAPADFLAPYSLAIYENAITTATGTSGAYTITVASATNITLGQIPSGTGIALGALVTNINGLVITLSLPNTGTVSGSVTFQGNFLYLINKDVNFIREVYGSPIAYGTPQYYALFGPTITSGAITNDLSFIMGPTPDAAYTAELHYYYYPVSIVQGALASVDYLNAVGTGAPGTYYNVPVFGDGSGALATVTIGSDGKISSFVVTNGGSGYVVGNQIGVTVFQLITFTIVVTAVNNPNGTSWLGDNFDTVLLYGSLVEAYTFMKGETDMMTLYNQKYVEALALAKRLGDGMERQDAYRTPQFRQAVT
jgi:hypothetical protein